jgi:hypothetical protein
MPAGDVRFRSAAFSMSVAPELLSIAAFSMCSAVVGVPPFAANWHNNEFVPGIDKASRYKLLDLVRTFASFNQPGTAQNMALSAELMEFLADVVKRGYIKRVKHNQVLVHRSSSARLPRRFQPERSGSRDSTWSSPTSSYGLLPILTARLPFSFGERDELLEMGFVIYR